MADILVTCPGCRGQITCDDAWAGQEVSCPLCNRPLIVPARAGAGAPGRNNPLVPVPPADGGKLALGNQPAAATPGRNIPIRNLAQPVVKKKSSLASLLPIIGIVVILGGAGYFGWPYFQDWRTRRSGGDAAGTTDSDASASAATNAPAPRPPATSLPIVAATWTLDSAAAQITDGRASGTLSGTNFVVDSVQAVTAGTAQVMRFLQGTPMAPDREIMVYLQLAPGESMVSRSFTASKETRGGPVSMVAKRWKADPRYAPKLQSYNTGYLLKLELGAETNGIIPGKVYVALPDKEQTVLSGRFDMAPPANAMQAFAGMSNNVQAEMMRRRAMMTNPPAGR